MAIARYLIDEVEENFIINFDIVEKEKKKNQQAPTGYIQNAVFGLASKFRSFSKVFIGG